MEGISGHQASILLPFGMRNLLSRLFMAAKPDPGSSIPSLPVLNDEKLVKLMLPRSWFTKKGPGVTASAKSAVRAMTSEQTKLAVRKGWIPAAWGVLR